MKNCLNCDVSVYDNIVDLDGYVRIRNEDGTCHVCVPTSAWLKKIICFFIGHDDFGGKEPQPNTIQPRYYIRCLRCGREY